MGGDKEMREPSSDVKTLVSQRTARSETSTTSTPISRIQIIKSKIRSQFSQKSESDKVIFNDSGSILRERGQSVTAECCSLGTRSAHLNDFEAEINVANTVGMTPGTATTTSSKKFTVDLVDNIGKCVDDDETGTMLNVLPAQQPLLFRVYPERWWLLLTVVLLNLANYSHWVAFPSVAKSAAKYYDQTGETMDLIPTVSYGLGVPCCLLATYVVEKYGLKTGLHIGGSLTGIGGLLCFLSSFPYLSDNLSADTKFYFALIGQALTGVACPFISCVPTKISQLWFGDDQRTLATILIGMSNPMGIVLGQGITPLLVHSKEDVPIMNIVWFIPAGLGSILTMWKVNANHPPSAPSLSALSQMKARKDHRYFPSVRKLLTNKSFMIMFFFVGGAMGYISCISTKIEQILCSRGYSDQLSGLSGSLILLCGTLASFPFGLVAYKTGRPVMVCKISSVFVICSMIVLGYFMNIPDHGVAIAFFAALMGIFSLGVYPLALELIVECTYPVDQAIGTAFIFLSSALQGVFLMEIENSLGQPLTDEEMAIQSCVDINDDGHQQPKDYSNFLYVINGYMIFFIVVFILFFKTEMKRTMADKADQMSTPHELTDSTKLETPTNEEESEKFVDTQRRDENKV